MDDDNGVSRLDGALAGLLASVLPDARQRRTVDEDRAMRLKAGIVVIVNTSFAPGATAAVVRAFGVVLINGADRTDPATETAATVTLGGEATLVLPIVARVAAHAVNAIEVRLIRP
jgi:hypothetical protein